MAASEHLHPELFHGSSHFFQEGELVEPRSVINGYKEPLAFATHDIREAAQFAGLRASKQGMLFAPIYSVEHADPERYDYRTGEGGATIARNNPANTKGLTVKKQVGWGVNTNLVDGSWFQDPRNFKSKRG